jgi:hypothetical protein
MKWRITENVERAASVEQVSFIMLAAEVTENKNKQTPWP